MALLLEGNTKRVENFYIEQLGKKQMTRFISKSKKINAN